MVILARRPVARSRRFNKVTFFHEGPSEFRTVQPVAQVAEERGYEVSFSQDPQVPAEIGIYCSHHPDPSNASFSVVMLHDFGQAQWPESPSLEPNHWTVEPWNAFDIGVLPGPAYSQCWYSVSSQVNARPRLGVFELGWPKADRPFSDSDRTAFARDVDQLRQTLALSERSSVLYAPSWENDGKVDDFVGSLINLPVNLLIKYWPGHVLPEQHQRLGDNDNVYIIDPNVDTMYCLALADVVVSDESNCLIEALLFDVPGISVTDWIVSAVAPLSWSPGRPQRFSEPPSCVATTVRSGLRAAVEDTLRDRAELRSRIRQHRDHYFSYLGQSSAMIMNVLDCAMTGTPWPVVPLTPQEISWARIKGGLANLFYNLRR